MAEEESHNNSPEVTAEEQAAGPKEEPETAANAEAKPAAAKPETPAKKPAAPPRELPDEAGIAGWIQGEEYPLLGALFDQLNLKKYDGLVMQIRKQELLPQHWQVISRSSVEEGIAFDDFYEVGRLRAQYEDPELAQRRLASLEIAWEELRGKQPTLWTAADLFAAMRRILEKSREADLYELLTAARDVWRNLSLPHGREQLEVLWAVLNFVRSKTKK
jgi:hypothetical protein